MKILALAACALIATAGVAAAQGKKPKEYQVGQQVTIPGCVQQDPGRCTILVRGKQSYTLIIPSNINIPADKTFAIVTGVVGDPHTPFCTPKKTLAVSKIVETKRLCGGRRR
jgi:hypothetical protein